MCQRLMTVIVDNVGFPFSCMLCAVQTNKIVHSLSKLKQPGCSKPPFGKNSECPTVWSAPMPAVLVCITSTYLASPGSNRKLMSFSRKNGPAGSKPGEKKQKNSKIEFKHNVDIASS